MIFNNQGINRGRSELIAQRVNHPYPKRIRDTSLKLVERPDDPVSTGPQISMIYK